MTTTTRPTRSPARPPMDARIRQRRIDVRRAGRRRRRRILVTGVVVVALAGAAVGITRSPLFAITGVRVDGVRPAQARVVKEAAQVRRGQNLLSADLDDALRRTTALPWVAAATVRREPPSTVVIDVVPRRPAAILRGARGEWLVDREGVVIAAAGKQRLPRIDLASSAVAVPGVAIDDEAARNALRLHAALPADVAEAVVAAEAVGPRTVRVRLALHALDDPDGFRRGRRTWVRMGAAGDVDEQVAVLRALLAQLRRGRAGIPSEVDVRVPGNPVVVP